MTDKEKIAISWQEFHVDTRDLANKLKASGVKWDRIIAIVRGGMAPAQLMANYLEIRNVDTICVASYDKQKQGEIKITKMPDNIGDGAGCLFIDELSDTGNTLKAIRGLFPKATFACPYVKPMGKPQADFYVREYPQSSWLYLPWEDLDFTPDIQEKIGMHLK